MEGPSSAPPYELLPAAVPHGAPDRTRIEPSLEQLLPQFAFAREAQEEPRERHDRDERPFDHHHRAGETLVPERRDAPELLAARVDAVEDRARPDEDVAEHRLDDADPGDVREFRSGTEPLGRRQRLEHGQPHDHSGGEEADVL